MALVSELVTHGSEFWIFGYGSLIWKPPPHFDQSVAGEDHRGTPESPGRVVTLIEQSHWAKLNDPYHPAPERVWGVAYRIRSERVAEVKEYLDIREINGYSVHHKMFQPASSAAATATNTDYSNTITSDPIRALVYIGTPDNQQFTGPQDPHELALHIAKSHGPSGQNSEYLLELNAALKALHAESNDVHIEDLSQRVTKLLVNEAGIKVGQDNKMEC
ncbi:hypothetical protein Cpir12675_004831 [Ceratocystis pirilliformis]|uniref:glutathione-specific gamma-glutamylcyclotransferase n=1 Tax=Ceratocystis pirilliformis TaxID=259994 RepID=A0ABR3YTT0_9PEZI